MALQMAFSAHRSTGLIHRCGVLYIHLFCLSGHNRRVHISSPVKSLVMNNRFTILTLLAMCCHPGVTEAQQRLADAAVELSCPEKAAHWLVSIQSRTGGWGPVAPDTLEDEVTVTDPAVTVFAATALLEAGGPVANNPHRASILHALHYLLLVFESQPVNGKKKRLIRSQLETQLGMQADASRALNFLLTMREQLAYERDILRLDAAIATTMDILEKRAARQQSDALIISSLRSLETAALDWFDVTADEPSPAENTRSTSAAFRMAGEAAVQGLLTLGIDAIADGIEKSKRKREMKPGENAFQPNEEFLSYTFYSESLESLDHDTWMTWRDEFEANLVSTQHDDGSWSEDAGMNSVFCTAAALLALHGKPQHGEDTAGE